MAFDALMVAAASFGERHAGSGITVVRTSEPSGVALLVVGAIDTDNSPDFSKVCDEAVAEVIGRGAVVLDLQAVRYVASTGIGAISTITAEAGRRGVKVFLYGVPGNVKGIMEMLGLWEFFSTIPAYEKAL